jgi:hypothetical protein
MDRIQQICQVRVFVFSSFPQLSFFFFHFGFLGMFLQLQESLDNGICKVKTKFCEAFTKLFCFLFYFYCYCFSYGWSIL